MSSIPDWPQGKPLIQTPSPADVEGAYFDQGRVDHALRALSKFRHTKGRWAGIPLVPDGWQIEHIIEPIWGWVRYDDEVGSTVRIVRTAWIEIPRKAGKSSLASGLANVLLLADREPGAEVYAAAGSLPQAARIFEDSKRMLATSKAAAGRVELLSEVIRVPRTGGIFRALSRIAETAHGLNVSGGIVDEVHVHKRRDLIDAIETGTGARSQPLVIFITTADEGREGSIYDEKHNYCRRIAAGTVVDPTFYGAIWAAEPTDDPFVESTWRKANPGLGTTPTLSYVRKEAARAQAEPSYFPTFARLQLNLRMRPETKWLSISEWDDSAGLVDESKLRRRRCWGGLDLSAVADLTAWELVFEDPAATEPDELCVVSRFWVPQDRVEELERKLQVPLKEWIRAGLLEVTEGSVIDYAAVEDRIVADGKLYDLQRVSYDRMFAGQLVQNVDTRLRGVEVTPVPQTFTGMSPAAKQLERLVRSRRLHHGGHQVLRWHADDVEVIRDREDNIKPVKPDRQKTSRRVDGIVALTMAIDGWMRRKKKATSMIVGY